MSRKKTYSAFSEPAQALEYCGPGYNLGIMVPGEPTLVRPADMTPAAVEAFRKKYPQYAGWWKEAEAVSSAYEYEPFKPTAEDGTATDE